MRLSSVGDVVRHLRNDVCVRIGVSSIHGVGIIALRDMPEGFDPFRTKAHGDEFINIPVEVLQEDDQIPESVKRMVMDFCAVVHGKIGIPTQGLNAITALFYMNHAGTPNVWFSTDDACAFTLRPIRAGEELTLDYRRFGVEPDFEVVELALDAA